MTFADLFSNDAEPLRNPDQGAGTSVLERPETKESPVRGIPRDRPSGGGPVRQGLGAQARSVQIPRLP